MLVRWRWLTTKLKLLMVDAVKRQAGNVDVPGDKQLRATMALRAIADGTRIAASELSNIVGLLGHLGPFTKRNVKSYGHWSSEPCLGNRSHEPVR